MTIIAIDPGISGGIAVKWPTGDVEAVRMPETAHDIAAYLRHVIAHSGNRCSALLEQVHAQPVNGNIASFKLGQNFGRLEGVLATLQIPYELVAPSLWMKQAGSLPKDRAERKRALKAFAQRNYPFLSVTLCTADALAMLAVKTREGGI